MIKILHSQIISVIVSLNSFKGHSVWVLNGTNIR